MTHDDLVERAARWLKNSRKCCVVTTETESAGTVEIPDAVGWHRNGTSTLIECKVNRSDFTGDRHRRDGGGKVSGRRRRRGYGGIGTRRYYMAPKGLITACDALPWGWGRLELCGSRVFERVSPEPRHPDWLPEKDAAVLVAEMRRVAGGFRRGARVGLWSVEGDCDHQLEANEFGGRHAFQWPDRPGEQRNVYNPLAPECSKCGRSVGEILGVLQEDNLWKQQSARASRLAQEAEVARMHGEPVAELLLRAAVAELLALTSAVGRRTRAITLESAHALVTKATQALTPKDGAVEPSRISRANRS